jgi:hypothetical protein
MAFLDGMARTTRDETTPALVATGVFAMNLIAGRIHIGGSLLRGSSSLRGRDPRVVGVFGVANLACDLDERRVPSCGSRAPRRVATRFIVHILVALALAAGLHAPAARFLSILCVGHPS